MSSDSDQSTQPPQLYHKIRHILLNDWDPIGVAGFPGSQTEYDGYVPQLCRMVDAQSSQSAIFDYLWKIETEHMELSGNRAHTQAIATRLVQLASRDNA